MKSAVPILLFSKTFKFRYRNLGKSIILQILFSLMLFAIFYQLSLRLLNAIMMLCFCCGKFVLNYPVSDKRASILQDVGNGSLMRRPVAAAGKHPCLHWQMTRMSNLRRVLVVAPRPFIAVDPTEHGECGIRIKDTEYYEETP